MALKQVGERSPHEEEIAHAKAGKHERRDHGHTETVLLSWGS